MDIRRYTGTSFLGLNLFVFLVFYDEVGIAIPRIEQEVSYILQEQEKLFLPMVLFTALIAIFFAVAKIFRYSLENWSLFKIYQGLLSYSMNYGTNRAERIIYPTLFVVSIVFVGNIFSLVCETKVDNNKMVIETLEEVFALKKPIYCTENFVLSDPGSEDEKFLCVL